MYEIMNQGPVQTLLEVRTGTLTGDVWVLTVAKVSGSCIREHALFVTVMYVYKAKSFSRILFLTKIAVEGKGRLLIRFD